MRRTRLLLAAMPKMLHDIVQDTVAAQPDMEIVGEVRELDEVIEMAERTDPDLIVTARTEAALPELYTQLIYRYPRIRWLIITPDGQMASMYALHPRRTFLEEVSPQGLLNAIRGAGEAGASD